MRLFLLLIFLSFSSFAVTNDGHLGPTGSLLLREPGGPDKITVTAPALSSSWTFTLPVDDGTTGQVLITNGSGVTSWSTNTAISSQTYQAKTGTYSANAGEIVDCTTGTFTVTLPTAASIAGQSIAIKNTGPGVITIATTSAQTVDGYASGVIKLPSTKDSLTVTSNGANWVISDWHVSVTLRYVSSGGQSIAASSAVTLTGWTKDFDDYAAFTDSTGIFLTPMAGKYRISIHVMYDFASFSSGTIPYIDVYKNGSALTRIANTPVDTTASRYVTVHGYDEIRLAPGDSITLRAAHGDATARLLIASGTYNVISISRIGN